MEYSTFFWGVLSGFLFALFFIIMIFRWAARGHRVLQGLIREVYHIDLLPFISRVEGLIQLALMESQVNTSYMKMYLEKGLEEIKQLKANVIEAVKRYEKYQD